MFKRLFVEGDASEPEKVVFEIVQIPGDRLSIEAGAWIADLVVQIAADFHLKARQDGHHSPISFKHGQSDGAFAAILYQKFIECRVAKVLFEIGAFVQVFLIDLWNRQSMPAKMLRELEKGDVLFADGIQDADSADALTRQPHNGAPRAAELALERAYLFRLKPVMLFEEPFQNFHEAFPGTIQIAPTIPSAAGAAQLIGARMREGLICASFSYWSICEGGWVFS